MKRSMGHRARCPYFNAPDLGVCGSSLCRLNLSNDGHAGTVATCAGVNVPNMRRFEALDEGGDRRNVWLRGGARG